MSLSLKLDRIAARADELRAMLSEGLPGEAYARASKELSDIEPVVARIGELREAERARPVCYLLDEVLQGTNSAERRIAVRTIVDHLIASWAIGVVTTHDLELAQDPSFAAHADSVHLQETLAGEGDAVTMTFDYTLRPGPATET